MSLIVIMETALSKGTAADEYSFFFPTLVSLEAFTKEKLTCGPGSVIVARFLFKWLSEIALGR